MLKKHMKQLKNESGVTLVELLAAIAILSIIVTAFLAYFTQAANTNSITNEVNEATFIAQEEMERVTNQSTLENLTEGNFEQAHEGYNIITTISKAEDSDLQKVVVIVYEGGKPRAKMETRLPYFEIPSTE